MIRSTLIVTAWLAAAAFASAGIELRPQAQSTGAGVFLDEICTSTNAVIPHLRISDAPRMGQTLVLARRQIEAAVALTGDPALTNCIGAGQARITRRTRTLDEEELKLRLMAQLQTDYIKDRGELELRFARSWATLAVPDEPLQLRILEMPTTGVAPLFVCRFELATTNETVGAWQVSLQAKVWREVWITRAALRHGTPLANADLNRERRDVLTLRDTPAEFDAADPGMELGEYVAANGTIMARSIKLKPVVRRGQSAEALFVDGALAVTMKVEVLEDGLPGQSIRIRNPISRRELRGKVQNETTIIVSL